MAGLSFHSLKVAAVERAADDATCVTVLIPPDLRETFAHHAGQYVTVRRTINDRDERRTYSIVTPPGANVLMMRTGCVGQSSAATGAVAATSTEKAAAKAAALCRAKWFFILLRPCERRHPLLSPPP